MNAITRFQITNLHGYKSFDLRLTDNTLILVGENGAGKTTVLQLLYYVLSGQWSSMAKYKFDEVVITIGKKKHSLPFSEIEKTIQQIDRHILRRLPPPVRHHLLSLMEQREGRLVTPELEQLCHHYDIPLELLLHEFDLFEHPARRKSEALAQVFEEINKSLKAQLLYLPTYRRIEQELNLIFKGLDERELRSRRELLSARRGGETFVELIEFGMKDVEEAINHTVSQLGSFARESLNNLTFGYLGDVVEYKYSTVDVQSITNASDEAVSNILNRIDERILSSANKQHVRQTIEDVKKGEDQTEHTKVICHYFTKLMAFQKELETKEAQITRFCRVCNEYMVDKQFIYDSSNFTFVIRPKQDDNGDREIKLHHLVLVQREMETSIAELRIVKT